MQPLARLHHSIVAHNESTGDTNEQFNRSVDDASSYNLLGYGGTFSLGSNGLNNIQLASGVSAGLTPLADYGGPTKTHVPLPNSPAVDAGNSSAVAGSGNDTITGGSLLAMVGDIYPSPIHDKEVK